MSTLKSAKNCFYPNNYAYIDALGDVYYCCFSRGFPMGNVLENDLCSIIHGNSYKKIRKELSLGDFPPGCFVCSNLESTGLPSARTQCDFPIGSEVQLKHIELKLSNMCNFRCRMCYAASSSRWSELPDVQRTYRMSEKRDENFDLSLEKHLQAKPYASWYNSSGLAIENILSSLEHVERISFSGGEPLIQSEHFEFLEAIPEEYKKKIDLFYTTNLSKLTYRGKSVKEFWKPFKSVELQVSADGIFEVYDYIREGGLFSEFTDNLKEITSWEQIRFISINCTMQAYNFFQIPEITKYYTDNFPQVELRLANLVTPLFLSARVFPQSTRDQIASRIQKLQIESNSDFSPSLRYLRSEDVSHEYNKFLNYTKDLDRYSGTNFKDLAESYGISIEGLS